MPDVCVTEFTDPGCPFAWSAEPFRLRLQWLYGDAVDWKARMVVLYERPEELDEKGMTPERLASSQASLSRAHGMPMATHVRDRTAATLPACRAVVAVREHEGDARALALLRRLRIRNFSGGHLDEDSTIAGAAADAGMDPAAIEAWTAEPAVEEALRADMAAAREPMPAARVLDDKLANWSGGVRYTCPSLEITRRSDGVRLAVPGFQPFAVYDVLLANLVPGVDRREPPASAADALAWAGEPLATQEVAELLGIGRDEAREQLGKVAEEHPLGFDGLWTLPGYSSGSSTAASSEASPATASASASSSTG